MSKTHIPKSVLPYLSPPVSLRHHMDEWLALTSQLAAQIAAGERLDRWQIAGHAASQLMLDAAQVGATRQ